MRPDIIAAPFSILTAVLSDTNITDIVRVFNESNVTTTGNFTFEPTTLLFVNYPEPGERPEEDEADGFSPFVIAAGKNSSTPGVTWPWGNSPDIESDNTAGNEGSENDDGYISADCGLDHDDSDEDDEDDTIANLNISSALQVSINMTLNRSSIVETPIFALNGTYESSTSFFIGIFDFGNSSTDTSPRINFLGGNYTAHSIAGGALSVLSNSTPALFEYSPPQNESENTDSERIVYLVFQQTSKFTYAAFNSSNCHHQTFSMAEFIDETGLGSPIGGTMVWVEDDDDFKDTPLEATETWSTIASQTFFNPGSSGASSPEIAPDTIVIDSSFSTSSSSNAPTDTSTDALETMTGTGGSLMPTGSSSDLPFTNSADSTTSSFPQDSGSQLMPSASPGSDSVFPTNTNTASSDASTNPILPTDSSLSGSTFPTGSSFGSVPSTSAGPGSSASGADTGESIPNTTGTNFAFPTSSSSLIPNLSTDTSSTGSASGLPANSNSTSPDVSTNAGSAAFQTDSGFNNPTNSETGSASVSNTTLPSSFSSAPTSDIVSASVVFGTSFGSLPLSTVITNSEPSSQSGMQSGSQSSPSLSSVSSAASITVGSEAPSVSSNSTDDGDDSDLPWCDELDGGDGEPESGTGNSTNTATTSSFTKRWMKSNRYGRKRRLSFEGL